MSARSDKIRASLADQLANIDDKLHSRVDGVQGLVGIQEQIGRLVASNDGGEAEIRGVLQDGYDSGGLRMETFQLVKSMLDRYVSVTANAGSQSPTPASASAAASNSEIGKQLASDDQLGSTTVIPTNVSIGAGTAEDYVQVGSVLRDRFMLQKRISGGSMGVVYKALDRRLAEAGAAEPWVAIKVLSPQLASNGPALQALQQEAAKGRCLTHDNIVRFIDLDRDEDLYFIVMEWLEGRTLASILDSPDSSSIDPARAFEIVRDVGAALDYAHRCGIVHADVKPGNIMIMPNGDAKLFDFGIARIRQKQMDADPKFDPRVLGLLTPAYSSMQVLTGEEPVPSDDIFSLACMLYRLIAGYRVFGPRNAAEAAEKGMTPQRHPSFSDEQWRCLKKALTFSRVTRFETMAEFLDALGENTAEPPSFEVETDFEIEEHGGSGRWIFLLIVFFGLFGVAAYQFGYLDEFANRFAVDEMPEASSQAAVPVSSQPEVVEVADAAPVQVDTTDSVEATTAEIKATGSVDPVVEEVPTEPVKKPAVAERVEPIVDFSTLPRPTAEIRIPPGGRAAKEITVTLRENGAPAVIDLIRSDTRFASTLRLEEIGFSGNRSPWSSGQYSLTDNKYFKFPVGQARARLTMAMASDPLREADLQSTLRIREIDSASSEIATITFILEDDDQRRFEAQLPANTVAFSMSQASVRERDPAVQIDIQRFNPDNTPLVVGYVLRDVTATEGEDYFAPSNRSISFGPGQRSARLLIPLVRDSEIEGDEAFIAELSTGDSKADIDIYHRIVVMIRDDE